VPSLHNNRAVDDSWRELNWRFNGLGLEKTMFEIIKPRRPEENKMKIEPTERERSATKLNN
jgi:hypothetical protein